MRSLRAILLAASVGVTVLAPTSIARAQSAAVSASGKDRAKKLFEEGLELEKKADYAGALAKYKEAEGITVTAGLRFHTGYCLEMTGKLTAALEEYEAADRLAREQNKHEVRAATAVRLEPLRARAPQIAIRLATPTKDAEVQLDGVAVVTALVDGGKAFRLDPGEHTVTARAPGYKAFTRKVQVPENVTTTVDVSLERVAPNAPVAPVAPAVVPPASAPAGEPSSTSAAVEPPAEAAPGRSRALPIATTAGAVVLAGTGIALFLVAGNAQSAANDECTMKLSCDDRRTRVRTLDALALGGFVGAIGLGVISVVLWTSKSPEHSAAASAHVSAGPGTFALEGSF